MDEGINKKKLAGMGMREAWKRKREGGKQRKARSEKQGAGGRANRQGVREQKTEEMERAGKDKGKDGGRRKGKREGCGKERGGR